jgi:hypothetical protein
MQTIRWSASAAAAAIGLALFSATGCKSNNATQPAQIIDANNGPDPAAANLAPVGAGATSSAPAQTSAQPSRVLSQRASGTNYSSGQDYSQAAQNDAQNGQAPVYSGQNGGDQADGQNYDPAYDQYENSADASQQPLYADQPPPPLPTYEQPELTQPGDLWTPGYWDYGTGGYYWVPGAWSAPPYQGALWTPGYWGYEGRRYHFHRGFWAAHIGFYGGVNYGFGYFGHGYEGGYWNNHQFYYNDVVNHVNVEQVHNVYVRNVTVNNTTINNYNQINRVNFNRVSYNGPGGIAARPQSAELAVLREQRTPPMRAQVERVQAAQQNREQFFAENHGRPAIAAAPEHVQADRTPPPPIRPNAAPAQAQRGGFGQPNQAGRPGQPPVNQQQREEQQHSEQLNQQHNAQVQQQQQARTQEQQRSEQLNQQHNAQVQQQQRAVQQEHSQQAARPEARPEAQPRPQPQARPETQPRPEPQARPEAQPHPQPQARPEPQARPQPQARPEAQPRPQPQARPEPQARPAEAPHAGEHPHP